jgi:hypothetical protein
MKDARRIRARTDRDDAGVVAGYVHELSARHKKARSRVTDENRRLAGSLRLTAPQPCEGA